MKQSELIKSILSSSLITGIGLAGGLAIGFLIANLTFESMNVHITGFLSGLLGFVVLLIGLGGGGALWGYGIAILFGASHPRYVARKAAVGFSFSTVAVGIALELVFGLLSSLGSSSSLPIHHAFTVVFVPSAGVMASLLSHWLTRWMGFSDLSLRSVISIGLVSAVSFLVVNIIMLQLGWIIGAPGAAERMTMITVMLLSNLGAALAGGAAFGYVLGQNTSTLEPKTF